MENYMQALIDAIHITHRDDWMDYITMIVTVGATIISLFLSCRAIRETRKIAERQNKIALFETRYQVFSALNFLLSVIKIIIINPDKEKKQVLEVSMKTYFSTTALSNEKNYQEDFSSFYTAMILDCWKIGVLFQNEDTADIESVLLAFNEYVSDIAMRREYKESEKRLEEKFANIEQTRIMETLEEYLKL